MELIVSDTNKGNKGLIYNGYIYRIDNVLKTGNISWRCTTRNCQGRIRTNSEMKAIIKVPSDHNHDKDDKKLARHHLRAEMKRKAQDDMIMKPAKLVGKQHDKHDGNVLESGDARSIKQSIYRERRKRPQTRNFINIASKADAPLGQKNTVTTLTLPSDVMDHGYLLQVRLMGENSGGDSTSSGLASCSSVASTSAQSLSWSPAPAAAAVPSPATSSIDSNAHELLFEDDEDSHLEIKEEVVDGTPDFDMDINSLDIEEEKPSLSNSNSSSVSDPLQINNTNEISLQNSDEFHIFGMLVASQLRELPLREALQAQLEIQTILTQKRSKMLT